MTSEKIGFKLRVKKGWPPHDIEHIWLERKNDLYVVKNFPLFIKGIAYEDHISIVFDAEGNAKKWNVVHPSQNSLVWIIAHEETGVLDRLNSIGCGIESGSFTDLSAINVPPSVTANLFDSIVTDDERSGNISIAYPVDRMKSESE